MAFLAKLAGVARQSINTLLHPASRAISDSTHTTSLQGLWGVQSTGLFSQYGLQVRNVMVEVTNDDLERAIRKMKRRLKEDNGIRLLRERQYHRKPSELKVLARKERDKRVAKRAFRAKLRWIQARQARYYSMALSVARIPTKRITFCCYGLLLDDSIA